MTTRKDNNSTKRLQDQVNSFLDATLTARNLSERDRDYYDGYQWTDEQLAVLRGRRQAPVVVNRVKPKIRGLKGLLSMRKTDVKAFPRNMGDDEEAAHAVTDALRFVADNNDFDNIKADCFENKIIEGYCAAIIEAEEKKDDIQIKINRIPWDRFYFDPHSTKNNFDDAKFKGQMIWMDLEDAKDMFPDKDVPINQSDDLGFDETFEDKPRWSLIEGDRVRVRIAQHYFIKKGVWHVAIFTDNIFLLDPRPSPYLDEFGDPTCPIVADSAYIDRNNLRYGEVRDFISQQDEINHRRSKALHLLSSRQTMSQEGSIKNVKNLKDELKKPDGHIVYQNEKGLEFLPTNDMTQGQIALYQDAKAELDSTSFNAQLAGERQGGDLSGKAIDKLQSAGSLEINNLYDGFRSWENAVFAQVWYRIKQFWDKEKWVRITDNQDNLRWVGFNTQITMQDFLEEIINDESKDLMTRKGASFKYQIMMQSQDPELQEIVEVRNKPAQLEVDVKIEQSYDVVNVEQEQFQTLAQFAQSSKDIDIIELIELSSLRNKDELIEKIEARRQQASQANGNAMQAQAQEQQVKNAKLFAETQKTTQEANQKAIENQILVTQPERVSSIAV